MSTLSSSLLLLLLTAIALLPILVAWFRPSGVPAVTGAYLVCFFVLIATRSDFSRPAPDVGTAMGAVAPGAPSEDVCNQALDVAQQGGIIVNRDDPSRVIVNEAVWRELPEQAQDALAACLENARPSGAAAGRVEILQQ